MTKETHWRINCPGSAWHKQIGREVGRHKNPDGVICVGIAFKGDAVPTWFESHWLREVRYVRRYEVPSALAAAFFSVSLACLERLTGTAAWLP